MNRKQRNRETPVSRFTYRGPHRVLASLISLFCCSLCAAEPPHIEKVQVGLPGGKGEQESPPYRSGAWAPVYVKIQARPDADPAQQFTVRVETTDSENAVFDYDTPPFHLNPNEDYDAVAYTRPGGAGGEITVRLVTADGQVLPAGAPPAPAADKQPLGPGQALYVCVGSRLLARDIAAATETEDRKGTTPFAYIDNVAAMPDRWYGYDAADVVVLSTGSASFVAALLDHAAKDRRTALAEWVRRGGKLIVSVGANRQVADKLLGLMPPAGADADAVRLLDCRIDGPPVTCAETTDLARWLAPDGRARPLENVELTRFRIGEGATALVTESCKDGPNTVDCPVVVESSCGLGRVWLTAFDLDGGAFAARDWADGRKAFWTKVQSEFTPRPPAAAPNPGGLGGGEPPTLLADMQRSLEDFENVPVVSFGWVALFILVYIVIVGPLDYVLLTRVFKRPELTWITFPLVVLGLSVLVYVAAYSMKGDDLRVNKIDLVEYDLTGPLPQAYGTTWFTLFSPRIQNYTVGVEPSAPGWASPAKGRAVVVAPLANPARDQGSGAPSLFRKPYAFAADASGLEHVPIPVWSTRSFQASWRGDLDAGQGPPPVQDGSADKDKPDPVRRDPNDAARLIGTIRNNLPVPLQSVTIFYQGNYYPAPDVPPGGEFHVQALWEGKHGNEQPGLPAIGWAADAHVLAPPNPDLAGPEGRGDNAPNYVPPRSRHELMKDLMFHPAAAGALNNSGLGSFDQGWRLAEKRTAAPGPERDARVYRDEVVLVARTPTLSDRAEAASQDPGCATRLWIDRLPDGKATPPALPGYLWQETYVRAYIPVPHPPGDKAPMP